MSPAYPAFSFVSCPHPPAPLPLRGRGRILLYFAGGFAPGTPALNRLRHLQFLPSMSPAGGLPSLPPAFPAFGLLSCPHPPRPPSPPGKGENITLFRRGLRPRHPCIKPLAALTVSAKQAPRARSLRFAAKTTGSGSLWAVPAAKERGDRGRWNYPSQATAAFEMVLSPGAGRTSAAGGTPPAGYHSGRSSQCRRGARPPSGTTAAGRASAAGGTPPPLYPIFTRIVRLFLVRLLTNRKICAKIKGSIQNSPMK